jgi:hypothetical protein
VTRIKVLAATALSLALVAGCGGQGATPRPAASLPPPSATAKPKPKPAPETPAQAIRRVSTTYFAVLQEAYTTSSDARLRTMSGPNCKACQWWAAEIRRQKRHDVRAAGLKISVKVRKVRVITKYDGQAELTVTFSLTRIVDSKGRVVTRYKAAKADMTPKIANVNGRWVILEIPGYYPE